MCKLATAVERQVEEVAIPSSLVSYQFPEKNKKKNSPFYFKVMSLTNGIYQNNVLNTNVLSLLHIQ
jgi:hypothetical protein